MSVQADINQQRNVNTIDMTTHIYILLQGVSYNYLWFLILNFILPFKFHLVFLPIPHLIIIYPLDHLKEHTIRERGLGFAYQK